MNQDGSITIVDGGRELLKFHVAVETPPAPRRSNNRDSNDAKQARALAESVVLDVRANMPHGALNNEMKDKGQTKYMCPHPKHLNNMVDTAYYELGGFENDNPPSFVYQMAALARCAREVGGGVCSMLAHVALGFITLRALPGLEVVLVVDKSFDHSYCALGYGDSTWFVCDPWPGNTYVIPWDDCYFPREDVAYHFRVECSDRVTVPYGVELAERDVTLAMAAAQKERVPGQIEMDHHYVHESNLLPGKATLERPILTPFDWGDGVGRQRSGGKFDIFG